MMFRIQKGYDTESQTFRLPVGMIRKLEEVAAKNNTSLNRVVIWTSQIMILQKNKIRQETFARSQRLRAFFM